MEFAATGTGVVEKIAELGAVWVDVGRAVPRKPGIALEDQELMFRAQLLAHAVHVRREVGFDHGRSKSAPGARGQCWSGKGSAK